MRLVLIALTAMLSLRPALAGSDRGAVALLPTVNTSGEKWEELRARQNAKVDEWVRTHVAAAGYRLIPAEEVAAAVSGLKLDMKEEENWATATLAEVGRKCGAAYVLFCAITFTEQKEQNRLWFKDKEGRTDVRVWLVDVGAAKAPVAGKTFVGRSGGNRISLDNKGSERQIQAAANAVRDATRSFLAPYKAK